MQKDTLFHIEWGDGDNSFVIAPDKATAKERMSDGKDMINSIVKLDTLYQMIFKAGQEDVILESKMGTLTVSSLVNRGRGEVVEFAEFWGGYRLINNSKWQAKKEEWGVE